MIVFMVRCESRKPHLWYCEWPAYRTSAATTRGANYALGLHCARRIGFTLERDVRIIANHVILTAIFRVQ